MPYVYQKCVRLREDGIIALVRVIQQTRLVVLYNITTTRQTILVCLAGHRAPSYTQTNGIPRAHRRETIIANKSVSRRIDRLHGTYLTLQIV